MIHLTENSGFAGRPRNVGMTRAKAPWLMFLDQDDYFYEEAMARLYGEAEETGADVVCGYYSIHDDTGAVLMEKSYIHQEDAPFFIRTLEERPDALKFRVGLWTKIYRRQLIWENGIQFPEDMPVEDMVFFTKLATVMKGFSYTDIPVVRYTRRESGDKSLTYETPIGNIRAVNAGFVAVWQILEQYGHPEYFRHSIRGSVDFYMRMFIGGDKLSREKAVRLLEALDFLLRKTLEYKLYGNSIYAAAICSLLGAGLMEYAADFLRMEQEKEKKLKASGAIQQKLRREIKTLMAKYHDEHKQYTRLQKRLENSKILRVIGKLRGWKFK